MKRIKLNITVLVVLIAALFTSCDKDVESSSVVLNLDKTGTITVYFYADLDRTHAGLEAVPTGTEVIVKINYSDFKAGVNGTWHDSTTVGTSGAVTLEIPADDDGVTVQITPKPFEYAQVQAFGTYENEVLKIFSANQTNINVSAGDAIIRQIVYNAPEDFQNFAAMVLLEGNIMAELNDTVGVENYEESISMTFHSNDWFEVVTTNSSGEYSVEVPANTEIFVTAIFQEQKYIQSENGKLDYEYELDAQSIGAYATSTDNVDIDFGVGIEVEE